ncbi:hypothetical protein Tcan_02624 [Toxocara canis]|uniref:Uncharacterized protein n=1 Tax=Toxocara canis TaxID=6265 RepID=A0A0B2VJM9_TOXCA|nr:hypothetical protein Tcan_02624 [Toxocara canis]
MQGIMLEKILIGLLYILMDTIGLVAVIIIIVTIMLERSLRSSQCYRMILYICLLDSIQVFIGLISGFLTIWPPEDELSTKIMSIISILIGMIFFIIFLTPWVTMRYEVSTYTWRYIRSSVAFIMAMTEACSLTPLSLISLVNYIGILIAIYYKVNLKNVYSLIFNFKKQKTRIYFANGSKGERLASKLITSKNK